ncbi:hypothetical protein [Ferroplasma sp.]|jgi:hypothetical protein|nr:hypothetical protein [Ferroplasma sp.]
MLNPKTIIKVMKRENLPLEPDQLRETILIYIPTSVVITKK